MIRIKNVSMKFNMDIEKDFHYKTSIYKFIYKEKKKKQNIFWA